MDWYRTRQPECIGTIEGPDQSHRVESAKQTLQRWATLTNGQRA